MCCVGGLRSGPLCALPVTSRPLPPTQHLRLGAVRCVSRLLAAAFSARLHGAGFLLGSDLVGGECSRRISAGSYAGLQPLGGLLLSRRPGALVGEGWLGPHALVAPGGRAYYLLWGSQPGAPGLGRRMRGGLEVPIIPNRILLGNDPPFERRAALLGRACGPRIPVLSARSCPSYSAMWRGVGRRLVASWAAPVLVPWVSGSHCGLPWVSMLRFPLGGRQWGAKLRVPSPPQSVQRVFSWGVPGLG